MHFDTLIQTLTHRLAQPLPGEEAQYKMAPFERPRMAEAMQRDQAPKLSAVMMLLYPENGEAHTVLMRRNAYDGAHSGQVSFPGGRKEPDDADLQHTALREMEEEIGVAANSLTVLGQLSELYIPPSRFLVTPYVGFVTVKPAFIPDPREVAELLHPPIALILEEGTVKTTTIKLRSNQMIVQTPYFDVFGHVVWGATAMMLSEFKTILQQP